MKDTEKDKLITLLSRQVDYLKGELQDTRHELTEIKKVTQGIEVKTAESNFTFQEAKESTELLNKFDSIPKKLMKTA